MGQLDRQKTGIFLQQRDSKEKTNKQTAGGVSDIISDSMWDGQTCFVLTVLCLQCLISLGQTHKGLTTWIVSVVCCTLTRTLNETSANISQDDCFILARLFFFKHLSTDKNGCQLIDPPPPSPQFTHTQLHRSFWKETLYSHHRVNKWWFTFVVFLDWELSCLLWCRITWRPKLSCLLFS